MFSRAASRTPFLALVTAGVALLWLRPRDVRPLLPLTIPMVIVIKIAAPGSIATLKNSFFPTSGPEGCSRHNATLAGDPTLISGRANFKPRLDEGMRRPLLGQGLGTRQTGVDNPLRNAPILDNQWLGTFLDVGLLGIVGWLWLIVRVVRRLGPYRSDEGKSRRLARGGLRRIYRGLRRRDVHVRLARVHPGDSHSLGASGARRNADLCAPDSSPLSGGAGRLSQGDRPSNRARGGEQPLLDHVDASTGSLTP